MTLRSSDNINSCRCTQ